jgi:hypothetical protein
VKRSVLIGSALVALAVPAAGAAPNAAPRVLTYVRLQGEQVVLSQAIKPEQAPPAGNVEVFVDRAGARPVDEAVALVKGRVRFVDRPPVTTVYTAWWEGPGDTTYQSRLGVVYVRPRVRLIARGELELLALVDTGSLGREPVVLQRCSPAGEWVNLARSRLVKGAARFQLRRPATGALRAYLPVAKRDGFVAGFSKAVAGRGSRCEALPGGRGRIAARLRAAGMTLEPPPARATTVRFFSVPATSYRASSGTLSLYEFPDVKTARRGATGIRPDGLTVNERFPNGDLRVTRGAAPLRWFRSGRTVAAYSGASPADLSALRRELGPAFRSSGS